MTTVSTDTPEIQPELKFRKSDWVVKNCPFATAKEFIAEHHYARGGSNTFVYVHGLYWIGGEQLCGVAWWLPPTRVACESVNRSNWKKVLSLSRMALLPSVPKNGASFLLSKSLGDLR